MKKLLIISMSLLLTVIFAGCSSGSTADDSLTMEKFTKSFTDAGAELQEEKPMFSMIKAKDGVMIYLDNSAVKIYEYSSESEIESAKKEYAVMKDWPSKGKFVLEATKQEAKDIFEKVE